MLSDPQLRSPNVKEGSFRTSSPAYLLHPSVVQEPSVRAGSCYDELGSEESGAGLQLSIIYEACAGLGDRTKTDCSQEVKGGDECHTSVQGASVLHTLEKNGEG